MFYHSRMMEKLDETLQAVVPIVSIVPLLSLTIFSSSGARGRKTS